MFTQEKIILSYFGCHIKIVGDITNLSKWVSFFKNDHISRKVFSSYNITSIFLLIKAYYHDALGHKFI